jgi:hypothetical protein
MEYGNRVKRVLTAWKFLNQSIKYQERRKSVMFWSMIIDWWGDSILNDESFNLVQVAAINLDPNGGR